MLGLILRFFALTFVAMLFFKSARARGKSAVGWMLIGAITYLATDLLPYFLAISMFGDQLRQALYDGSFLPFVGILLGAVALGLTCSICLWKGTLQRLPRLKRRRTRREAVSGGNRSEDALAALSGATSEPAEGEA